MMQWLLLIATTEPSIYVYLFNFTVNEIFYSSLSVDFISAQFIIQTVCTHTHTLNIRMYVQNNIFSSALLDPFYLFFNIFFVLLCVIYVRTFVVVCEFSIHILFEIIFFLYVHH